MFLFSLRRLQAIKDDIAAIAAVGSALESVIVVLKSSGES